MGNERGFTLIELILVIAILGFFLSMVFSPFIFTLRQFDNQNKRANEISDARTTMDYLTREIRKANSVKIVNNVSPRSSIYLSKEDSLMIDSQKYTLDDGELYKNDIKIIEGINKIKIEITGIKIEIEITIGDYNLSSDIYLRE